MSLNKNPLKKYYLRGKRERKDDDFSILYNITFSNRLSSFKRNKFNLKKDFNEKDFNNISSKKKRNLDDAKFSTEKKSIPHSNITNYSSQFYDNSDNNISKREKRKMKKKVKIPLFKYFKNEKNEKIQFKCYPDFYFNCKNVNDDIKKNILNDFDHDVETDNEQREHEFKKMIKFLENTFDSIHNSNEDFKKKLSRKLIFEN